LARTTLLRAQAGASTRTKITIAAEFLAWAATLAWLGAFEARHAGDARLLISAAAVQAWTVVVGAATLKQRLALARVDFGAPPMAVQARLAALRINRARLLQWALLTGQIIWWIPFATIAFESVGGIDIWVLSPFVSTFLILNLIAGVVFIPFALAVGRVARRRLAGTRLAGSVLDAASGHDLAEASAFAARLTIFERG
jgi:hypothetical protein